MADNSYDSVESSQDGEDLTDDTATKEKVLKEAFARFRLAEEAEGDNRREALDDMKFAAGDQWDPSIKSRRDTQRRPCLTINRLPQQIRQVTNDQRQNRPSIKVHPVDDHADIETGKVLQGLVRHIEYNSSADAAYDQAVDSAVRGGWGFYRFTTAYRDSLSFDQEILIKRIRNPFSVFFDPHSVEPDGSDAAWAFIVDTYSKEEYKAKFPNSKLARTGEWDAIGNSTPDWMPSDSARVAEYFYKEYRAATLVQLSDGQVIEKDKLEEFAEKMALQHGISPDLSIVQERETQIPVIKWCKINACEILEETEWPGRWIPIVPVYGEELDIDGKVIRKGIVRDAKDPQRMYNVWKSYETETIALTPRSPWIADKKSIEGYEGIWETANTEPHSYLPYNSRPDVAPPQRQVYEPAVQAITQAAMLAADDIKATTGIYDAALGARSNETSGIAIRSRSSQAQTSNFHYVDNLTRSLRHGGRILIDLIPKIYDTASIARIIGEDGEQKVVKINQPTGEQGKDGKELIYDLSVGKYDVTVDVGPSYASKRQEAAASMMDFSKAVPQVAAACADLIVKNMDWPGAQEFAERIKKTLPPNLVDDPNGKGQQIPPQIQAQMQQQGQMIEQMTAQLQELNAEKEQKLLELESKERIEMAKLETQATIKLAELQSSEDITLLAHQIRELDRRQQMLRSYEPIEAPEEPQEFAPEPAGAMSAMAEPEVMDPTGGESPGLPMEGFETP